MLVLVGVRLQGADLITMMTELGDFGASGLGHLTYRTLKRSGTSAPAIVSNAKRVSMYHAGSRLTIEITVSDDQHLVELSGEVDMVTTPELDNAVASVVASELRTVILDLRNVTFIDVFGLRSLLAANTACCEGGHQLRIVPGHRVQRLLEVTGTEPDLPLTRAFETRI